MPGNQGQNKAHSTLSLAGALSSDPPASSKPAVLSHVQKPKVSPSLLNPMHQDVLFQPQGFFA